MNQIEVNKIIERVLNSYPYNTSNSEVKKIKELTSRTNPYRLSEYDSDVDFIRDMIKTYLDKSWTTIFGNLMEQIQIEVSGGIKTNEVGVDIEFPNKNIYVGSKSGSNWANSDQRKSMLRNSKLLKESKNSEVFVVCSYGKTTQKYEYYTQLAGQKGWEFLTNDSEMYSKIMEGFEINNTHLKNLKKKIFGEIEKYVLSFWTSNFYKNDEFQKQMYLDYVSKSNEK
jgi:hypothetical protein